MNALPSSDMPLVYQLDHCKSVNALAYIDETMSDKTKSKINRLIKKELQNLSTKEEDSYIENLQLPETKKLDTL